MFTFRRMHALGALRYAPTESDLNVIQKIPVAESFMKTKPQTQE